MPTIQTDRLTISEFDLSDQHFILELVNTPSWLKYIGDRRIYNLKDARNYLINGPLISYKQHGFGLYKLQLRETSETIGMCGLLKRDELEHPDIGFALLPAFQGLGYGFESSRAVLDDAEKRLGISQVLAITIKANERSIHLLEKLGLHFVKMIHGHDEGNPLMLFSRIFNEYT